MEHLEPTSDQQSSSKLVLILLLLVSVTWVPGLGLALYSNMPNDNTNGEVVVLFPFSFDRNKMFDAILQADGVIVQATQPA